MYLREAHNVNVAIFPLAVMPISSFYCYHFYKTINNTFYRWAWGGKKTLKLSDIELEENLIHPLIGFHAITGNDYVSSFFRKDKKNVLGY